MTVGAKFDRQSDPGQPVAHAPIAGLKNDQPLWPQHADPAPDLLREIAAIGRVVEFAVMDTPAQGALIVAKMPHGREEIGEATLVLRHIGRLRAHLHLENGVLPGIEPVERG